MPKIDVNAKRGYEASVPVQKIWSKFESGEIDENFCVPLGENEKKEDRFIHLDQPNHILVAGAVLSGVGMFRRVALATLLKFNKTEDLKFILIDLLKMSFYHFKNIENHLVFPIITDNDGAIKALEWAKQEVERRFEILSRNRTQNIQNYNEKNPDNKIPRIVIFITELGELMNNDSDEIIHSVVSTAMMAKAVGIHFILTTQRPSKDVLPDLLTYNMSVRIAFRSGSEEGSYAILGRKGAEELLGQGDMIVDTFDSSEKMQGYCLEEEEVEKMIF